MWFLFLSELDDIVSIDVFFVIFVNNIPIRFGFFALGFFYVIIFFCFVSVENGKILYIYVVVCSPLFSECVNNSCWTCTHLKKKLEILLTCPVFLLIQMYANVSSNVLKQSLYG